MVNYWGPPTWIFFHSFIECIKPEFYKQNISTIISIIKNVCFILPCPFCVKDAKQVMKSLNNKRVPTKEHMKQFLFNFHNSVNVRLRKPRFTNYDKYKYARFNNITNTFLQSFKTPAFSKRFTEQLQRKKLKKRITDFIYNNTSQFIWR